MNSRGGPPFEGCMLINFSGGHTWIVHNFKFWNIFCKEYLLDPKGKSIPKPKKKVTEELGLGHLYVRKCCQALELSFIDYVTYSHQAIHGSTDYGSPAIRYFFKHCIPQLFWQIWAGRLADWIVWYFDNILSLLPSPWFCISKLTKKTRWSQFVLNFQKRKSPSDFFQMVSTEAFQTFWWNVYFDHDFSIKNLEPRHHAFEVRACK